MEQHKCTHPPESKQLMKAHLCTQCGNAYSLLRCMRCNMYFSHCKVCTKDKLLVWE